MTTSRFIVVLSKRSAAKDLMKKSRSKVECDMKRKGKVLHSAGPAFRTTKLEASSNGRAE